MSGASDTTMLLQRWSGGDREALDELMAVVNGELRKLAQSALKRENPGHTLQATALVNELYIRLVDQRRASIQDRHHFFGVAATVMRRILVDYAKARKAAKRGGSQVRVELSDFAGVLRQDQDLLDIDSGLTDLEQVDARKAKVVELKFFGGFDNGEIAAMLAVSDATVERDWAMAKSWLYSRMQPGRARLEP